MTPEEIKETRAEAQEIIWNATRDYKAGKISLWQWWDVTRSALRDGFAAGLV